MSMTYNQELKRRGSSQTHPKYNSSSSRSNIILLTILIQFHTTLLTVLHSTNDFLWN